MIFNMVGGGGGSGATLVVSSPANVSVTVSKDDKSYTKNSGSLGSTTFKGLATGTWTVTISGNGQTATKTIEITADYAITIAFFSASINITYPATSTCVVTNSGGQTVASDTNTGSSPKTWTATVGATGTYTVTATATDGSGKTNSTTVSITTAGQSESVTLFYVFIVPITPQYWTFSNTKIWGQPTHSDGVVYGIDNGIMTVTVDGTAGDIKRPAGFVYNNKVDLTHVKTVKVTLSLNATVDSIAGSGVVRFAISESDTDMIADGYYAAAASLTGWSAGKDFAIDTTQLSGKYNLVFGFHGWGTAWISCTCSGIELIS